jgi:polyisoprenoid-binding protein YceI
MASTELQLRTIPTAGTWELEPVHSTVEFWARHLGLSKVRGRFSKFSAEIQVAPRAEDSRFEATLDAASISTNFDMRDNHLKSADFLDVESWPEIEFVSTSVEPGREGHWDVAGDLTIRGITRQVTLDVEFHGEVDDPQTGGKRAGFSASLEFNREDFGMTWNGAVEVGGFVGKQVHVEIEAEALLATPA